jgi:transcriptional regulator with XRE-family HTH domain
MKKLIFPLSEKEAKKLGVELNTEKNKNALFPTRLRALRNMKKISQADLARELDVTKSTIGLYEIGENVPDIKILSRMANYFNVSADFLIGPDGVEINDKEIQAASDTSNLCKESIKILNKSKTSGNSYLSHLIDLLIEDSKPYSFYQEESGVKGEVPISEEQYEEIHAGLLRTIGAFYYETFDIAPRLIEKGDSRKTIEEKKEIAEDARLDQLRKKAIKFKRIRRANNNRHIASVVKPNTT